MDISIIIVNYKSKGLTLNSIRSIKEAAWEGLRYEIIVVDNDSGDLMGEILAWQYPDVIFIQNHQNLGMGAGNNVGIKKANGRYVVIMNPDTIAFPDTFKKLFDFMETHPDVGIVGPQQLNPDRSIQDSCYRWYELPTFLYRKTFFGRTSIGKKNVDHFLMRDYDRSYLKEVDWLLGSFLFCRASALKQVGAFDERYFLYLEDTDLCKSMWAKNWKVVYFPEAKIIHNHNRESSKIPWYKFFINPASRHHFVSWLKYLQKWQTK